MMLEKNNIIIDGLSLKRQKKTKLYNSNIPTTRLIMKVRTKIKYSNSCKHSSQNPKCSKEKILMFDHFQSEILYF